MNTLSFLGSILQRPGIQPEVRDLRNSDSILACWFTVFESNSARCGNLGEMFKWLIDWLIARQGEEQRKQGHRFESFIRIIILMGKGASSTLRMLICSFTSFTHEAMWQTLFEVLESLAEQNFSSHRAYILIRESENNVCHIEEGL